MNYIACNVTVTLLREEKYNSGASHTLLSEPVLASVPAPAADSQWTVKWFDKASCQVSSGL